MGPDTQLSTTSSDTSSAATAEGHFELSFMLPDLSNMKTR